MTQEEILKKVISIVMDKLGVNEDQVTLESKLNEDLGADSLDKVELIMEIEKEFDIAVNDEDAENVTTVSDIVELLKNI